MHGIVLNPPDDTPTYATASGDSECLDRSGGASRSESSGFARASSILSICGFRPTRLLFSWQSIVALPAPICAAAAQNREEELLVPHRAVASDPDWEKNNPVLAAIIEQTISRHASFATTTG
jgi:hypothetical protein